MNNWWGTKQYSFNAVPVISSFHLRVRGPESERNWGGGAVGGRAGMEWSILSAWWKEKKLSLSLLVWVRRLCSLLPDSSRLEGSWGGWGGVNARTWASQHVLAHDNHEGMSTVGVLGIIPHVNYDLVKFSTCSVGSEKKVLQGEGFLGHTFHD